VNHKVVAEKVDILQGLVLGCSADLCLAGAAGEELTTLCLSHLCRVTLLMEKDEPLDPADMRLFRSIAIVSSTDSLPHLVEQLGLHAQGERDRG
jgi:hypothetical protein